MNLSLMIYSEIDITCILLLVYVIYKSYSHVEKRESWHFFQLAIYFIILFILSDLVWAWMEYDVLLKTLSLSYLVNCVYFLFCISGIASWFFYTEHELETEFIRKKYFLLIASVPLLLMLAVLVTNNYNGCLFYFDQDLVYQRGSLNPLAILICCLYLSFCVIHSLIQAFKKENYARRQIYLNLAGFALPSAVSAILQVFISDTPLPCMGLTVSILLVYINSQELLVSIDPLTKLNNRYHLMRYLSSKMEHRTGELYLFILDVDKFKQINDTYGHIEGDRALLQLASILKKTAAAFNCFVARYGGDEFILIYETDQITTVKEIPTFIQEKLLEYNENSGRNYKLQLSIGYARYEETMKYIPEFISAADNYLYKVKQAKAGK